RCASPTRSIPHRESKSAASRNVNVPSLIAEGLPQSTSGHGPVFWRTTPNRRWHKSGTRRISAEPLCRCHPFARATVRSCWTEVRQLLPLERSSVQKTLPWGYHVVIFV